MATPVAAICGGATDGLANAGMLDVWRHTSNDQDYIRMAAPYYAGEKLCQHNGGPDSKLVTAQGEAA